LASYDDRDRKWVKRGLTFAGWTLFGLLFACQSYFGSARFGNTISWSHALVLWMPCGYAWACLTPAILWCVRRFPVDRRRWARSLLIHVAAMLFFALASSAIYMLLRQLLVWPQPILTMKVYRNVLLGGFHIDLIIYGMLVGIIAAVDNHRRYREREIAASQLQTELAHAQLAALKAQLQPHFLFNTLNTIGVLMNEDVATARAMLLRLSKLLRIVLHKGRTAEVPLRTELDLLENYLDIERLRFQDRLKVKMSIDPRVLDAFVPDLILQPLVENAIKYGIAPRSGAGHIEVSVERDNGFLRLEVRDDGPGIQEGFSNVGTGLGLVNTRMRLQQLYGDAHSFELRDANGGGLVVSLTIPFSEPRVLSHTNADAEDSSTHRR
jgi:sensor histidine kinase YesM